MPAKSPPWRSYGSLRFKLISNWPSTRSFLGSPLAKRSGVIKYIWSDASSPMSWRLEASRGFKAYVKFRVPDGVSTEKGRFTGSALGSNQSTIFKYPPFFKTVLDSIRTSLFLNWGTTAHFP